MRFKWLTTRSAYLIIVPLLFVGSILAYWLPSEHRLRAGTVLLGLVITRYVAMWLHQHAYLFATAKDGLSKTESAERRLTFLFECQMDDLNAMGSRHKPIHVKLDESALVAHLVSNLQRLESDG